MENFKKQIYTNYVQIMSNFNKVRKKKFNRKRLSFHEMVLDQLNMHSPKKTKENKTKLQPRP